MVRSLIRHIALVSNVLFLIPLLLSYLAKVISPDEFWPLAFFGLSYPIWLCINLLYIIFWLWRKRWLLLISLSGILVGWNSFQAFIQINPNTDHKLSEGLSILSYNVYNFDLYNWRHNVSSRNKMMDILRTYDPDIICFQEFYTDDYGPFENLKLISEITGLKHVYFEKTLTLRNSNHWGIAIYSKHPIIKKEAIYFPRARQNLAIYVDMKVGNDTFRVFNAHLQSIYFNQSDYAYLEEIQTDQKKHNPTSSRKILGKIKRGFQRRAGQVKLLKAAIDQSKHPVIVAGDFNDPPVSFAYHELSRDLQDAFVRRGSGLGSTYAGKLPALRIDYLLFDHRIDILGFKTIRNKISDHYPIIASFELN